MSKPALDVCPARTHAALSSNISQWANWTITYLDKHVLVLHHQRIGVNVAGEWFALVGVGAVLQLAGDIQRLCSHTDGHTSGQRFKQMKKGSLHPELSALFWPPALLSEAFPVKEKSGGGGDRWPQRPIAFLPFNQGASWGSLSPLAGPSQICVSSFHISMINGVILRLWDCNIWHKRHSLSGFVWLTRSSLHQLLIKGCRLGHLAMLV